MTGGCLHRCYFEVPGPLGLGKRKLSAGCSFDLPGGTPPLVYRDGVWTREEKS